MKIVVLGAGAQGRVIAEDLARSLPRAVITVADLKARDFPGLSNVKPIEADLSAPEPIARLLAVHDLGVGALPSRAKPLRPVTNIGIFVPSFDV